jgi:sialate O-acetylesterase
MQVSDLRGTWRFQLGDDPGWADPAASDKDWQTIFVPSRWEEEGYWGYDGYAWYRNRFQLPDGATKYALYLDVGRIDDVNDVYVNGHFVGSGGSFPPDYKTAFHVFNRYPVPARFLRADGYNVVAIRVFDNGGEGGLLEGRPGLYANLDEPALALDLAGPWQFRTGDRPEWRTGPVDPKRWDTVTVPGRWERQGFPDYDGLAWYRLSFVAPENLRGEPLALLLGKIDDFDETYLNGERIGATGRMGSEHIEGWEWQAMRNYPIPEGLLRFGEENTLAVRVYDGLLDGGIFEGPIGITYLSEAGRWEERSPEQNLPPSPFRRLLDWLRDN